MSSISSTYRLRSSRVPRSITKMAREHHFGRRHASYSNRFEILSFINIALVSLPMSAGALYLPLYLFIQLLQGMKIDTGMAIVGCFLLFIGILLLGTLVLGIYRTYESLVDGWFVSVYDQGCILQKRKEGASPFSWDEIETFWRVYKNRWRNRLPRSESFTIQREDGYKVVLTRHGGDLNRVTEVINTHLCERLLPRLLAQYDARVLFGPCGIDQEGFTLDEKDGKVLPWSRFARLEIKETFLLIHEQEQKFPWACLFTGTLPNLSVLMALVDLVHRQLREHIPCSRD